MAKKNQKKVIALVGIVLAVAILIYLASSNNFLTITGSSSSGLTIQSISPTQFISSNTDLNSVFFLINSVTGGGQSIVGDLVDGQDFKSESGYETQYPLQITAQSLDEQVLYKIGNTGSPIYSFSKVITTSSSVGSGQCENWNSLDNYFTSASNAPSCPSATTKEIPVRATDISPFHPLGQLFVCQRICIQQVQSGVTGDISPSSVQSQVRIDLTARGEKISQTVGTGQDSMGNLINPSANFYSNTYGLVATVQDIGKLWQGNFIPDSTPYKGYYDIGSSNWKVTNNARIQEYNNNLVSANSYFDVIAEDIQVSSLSSILSQIDSKILSVNNVVLAMKQDNYAIGSSQTVLNPSDRNNGQVKIIAPTQISQAQLVFKVKAKWVGVLIPAGKPQIVSAQCPTYNSGEDGKIILSVKNVGDDTGNFVSSVDCTIGEQSYNQPAVTVLKGQTVDIIVPINAGTTASGTDSCTVKVADFNFPTNYAQVNTNCQILAPRLCSEAEGLNGFTVLGGCIKQCINGERKDVKCCASDETVIFTQANVSDSQGGYSCKKIENPINPTCKWYDLKCKLSNTFQIIGYILVALGGLISLLFSRGLFSRFVSKEDTSANAIVWLISLIIGGGVGFLLYVILFTLTFWIILGSILVGLFIVSLIPRFK